MEIEIECRHKRVHLFVGLCKSLIGGTDRLPKLLRLLNLDILPFHHLRRHNLSLRSADFSGARIREDAKRREIFPVGSIGLLLLVLFFEDLRTERIVICDYSRLVVSGIGMGHASRLNGSCLLLFRDFLIPHGLFLICGRIFDGKNSAPYLVGLFDLVFGIASSRRRIILCGFGGFAVDVHDVRDGLLCGLS